MEKVSVAVKFFKDKIDEDIEDEEKYGVLKAAHAKLSNNEKLAVIDGMKEKAPGTNRMYSTILGDYINFKEADKTVENATR